MLGITVFLDIRPVRSHYTVIGLFSDIYVEENFMPIYEYECTDCHHVFESIQKMSDAPLEECPACHKKTLKKLISAAGFRLKGSGWYATDFKNAGKTEKSAAPPCATGCCPTACNSDNS